VQEVPARHTVAEVRWLLSIDPQHRLTPVGPLAPTDTPTSSRSTAESP
jgi:hypothetical protein